MANKEISNNNPEKELTTDNSISDDQTKPINKKNTTQNKKKAPKNEKTTKTLDEISDALERDNFMTAEEAKKFGLIDSVVEKRK